MLKRFVRSVAHRVYSYRGAQFFAREVLEKANPQVQCMYLPNGKKLFYGNHSSKRFDQLRRDIEINSFDGEGKFRGKEPETVQWINELSTQDNFWDIGANVGTYSLYAALQIGAKVISFEPLAANYYGLNHNIFLNRIMIGERLTSVCVSLYGSEISFSSLNVSSFDIQSSGNSYDVPIDAFGNQYVPEFKQGSIGASVDFLIEKLGLEPPTAIKIDVDGHEMGVLKGARNTLMREGLRRVVVEIDMAQKDLVDEVQSLFQRSGFMKGEARRSEAYDGKNMIYNMFFCRR